MVNIKDGRNSEAVPFSPVEAHPPSAAKEEQREVDVRRGEEQIGGRAMGASATALSRVGPSDDGRG